MYCSVICRGAPSSLMMTSASSAFRAAMPSEIAPRISARSFGSVSAKDSNARRAAATARSTSTGLPSGICPTTSSVAASCTSNVPFPSGSTHRPSMRNFWKTRMSSLLTPFYDETGVPKGAYGSPGISISSINVPSGSQTKTSFEP